MRARVVRTVSCLSAHQCSGFRLQRMIIRTLGDVDVRTGESIVGEKIRVHVDTVLCGPRQQAATPRSTVNTIMLP